MVEFEGSDVAASDVAMHVAAMKPKALATTDVAADLVQTERRIATEKAAESGKPAEIVAKMVEGSVQKFLKEVSLLNQPFVKNGQANRRPDAQGRQHEGQVVHAVRGGRGHRKAGR